MTSAINTSLLVLPNSAKSLVSKSGQASGAWFKYMLNSNQALYDLDTGLGTTNDSIVTTNTTVTSLTTVVSQNTPPGVIFEYAATNAPTGWLNCNGDAVSRATYAALFAIIGTTYGSGDGSITFNLPDKRGRAGIGQGTGSGLTSRTIGTANIGEETHLLITSEMPAHTHNSQIYNGLYATLGGLSGTYSVTDPGVSAIASSSTGGDGAHNNMQPSIVMNYIIKT